MTHNKKKLVMCGCHIGGRDVISSLIEEGYEFSYFVCLSKEQSLRYDISGYFDYSAIASQHSIPIYYPESYSLKTDKDIRFFQENKFDLIIQGGWQRLFPTAILNQLKIGAIGLHGSSDFLPKGRGRSPMNWSLILGKERFIMHLFMIKSGVDDGDILDTYQFDINIFDDICTLYYKYTISYRELLLRNLKNILSNEISPLPQVGTPTYYSKRNAKDAEIHFEEMDLIEIYNFIRAQTRPYPGAFAKVDNQTIKIWKAQPFDTRITYPSCEYGSVVESFDGNLIIKCLGGSLLVTDWEYFDTEVI